jgi:hypothetical protein
MPDHSTGQPFHIHSEWLDRTKPTPTELNDIVGYADSFLPLSLGALPVEADPSNYIHSGLKLPK